MYLFRSSVLNFLKFGLWFGLEKAWTATPEIPSWRSRISTLAEDSRWTGQPDSKTGNWGDGSILLACFLFFKLFKSWVFASACRLSLVGASGDYSSCSAWTSHCSGFLVVKHRLVPLQHVESSWTEDRTDVPYMARWILYYWTTREVLDGFFF